MNEYMILFFGGTPTEEMSDSAREQHETEWDNWLDQLEEDGMFIDGMPLEDAVVSISQDGEEHYTVPVDMSNEVTGYVILECESLEQAVTCAKSSPVFAAGGRVQVRPIMRDGDSGEDEDEDEDED